MRAVGGGSATINPVHHFDLKPDLKATRAAISRNLLSLQQTMLGRIGT